GSTEIRRSTAERPLTGACPDGFSWPKAPVDESRLNDRCRDIAAVGSAALNGGKGLTPVVTVPTESPTSSPIHDDLSAPSRMADLYGARGTVNARPSPTRARQRTDCRARNDDVRRSVR